MGNAVITEITLERGVRAVRLENDLLAATVLVDKGADIYELIYKPKGIDVLWKSPWGLRRPGGGHPSAFIHVRQLDRGVRGRLAGDLSQRRRSLRRTRASS